MLGVNRRSVKQARLMGMSFNTIRMLLIAVIVLNIQMRMRWRPLDHQKGGKQKENKKFTGTLLDHDGIEFNPDCSLERYLVIPAPITTFEGRLQLESS